MPTYDYKCTKCNHSFEEFQKMTDDHLEFCPNCNGKVKRLIGSGIAPIFKGSGFYQTDYKNGASNGKTKPAPESKKTESPSTKEVKKEKSK